MSRYVESSRQAEPPAALRAAVEAALGDTWLNWSKPDTGLSAAHRFVVRLAGGRSIFVKAATTPETQAWLRNEHLALRHAPPDLCPRTIAWIEQPAASAILVQEALVHGHWPASHRGVVWREGDLGRVFNALQRLAAARAPGELGVAEDAPTANWRRILAAPAEFVTLGLCSRRWLAAHGGALVRAEAELVRTGAAFVHGDVRSDNICIGDDGAKLVDWSNARRGAAETDLASFLPTAHLEGGPLPFDLMPGGGGWAATQCANAALRAIQDQAAPPWLRKVFVRLAEINLDWACSSLKLSARDGASS